MNYQELQKYCKRIYSIVGEERIENEGMSETVVSEYYTRSAFYYKTFHSSDGAMHLPIEFSDKTPHSKKLLYQADHIDGLIKTYGFTQILELGCGMGFNTHYLAQKHPDKNFTGIDLTANNIRQAKDRSNDLGNVNFIQGDFDELGRTGEKYDLIFAVETLCHSKDVCALIHAYSRKLTENGKMVIFDGYVKPDAPPLTREFDKKAYKLLSWGFALPAFQKLEEVMGSNEQKEVVFTDVTEYSSNILPNLSAFQNGAQKTLRFPFLLKSLLKTRIISLALIKQISAGLFGPYFIHLGFLGYYKLEVTRKVSENVSSLN